MRVRKVNKEIIVSEAVRLIEENGQPSFSLHELARRLDIKTPSLYNHIKSTKELQHEVFKYAIDKFVENQTSAIAGKQKDDAVKSFAKAYYSFAQKNKGLYRLIMSMPLNNDDTEKEMAVPLLEIVANLLSDYGLCDEAIAHWQRVLRAILHGFISQEDLGYFYYYTDADSQKSQEIAIQCFLSGLHAELDHTSVKEELI